MRLFTQATIPLNLLRGLTPSALVPEDRILNPALRVDFMVEGDRITGLWPSGTASTPVSPHVPRTDLGGAFVLPGWVDAHTHLDKAHSWNRSPNRSGTFEEALHRLGADKDHWTHADLRHRAEFTLRSAYAHGVRAIRTHLDTGLPWAQTSYETFQALAAEWSDRIELQYVSLCSVADYATAQGSELADLPVAYGASALGGMPIMSPRLPQELDRLFELAAERAIGLDLHVDENSNPAAECLRAVAEAVIRHRFPYPVTCGHCCSLALQDPARQQSTLALVREAGIHIISLPLCNLYLQDRRAPDAALRTPTWRGITLIHEFMRQGTVTACASDNVRDAFFAFGDLDTFEVYQQSVRIAHLDHDLARSLEVVTTAPARIMGIDDRFGFIGPGAIADAIVFDDVRTFSELLSRPAQRRRLLSGEAFREAQHPSYRELAF